VTGLAVAAVPFLDLGALHRGLEPQLMDAMQRVLRANDLVLGAECTAFEDEFAAYCGVGHCVGVGNGLDALKLALRALGIGPGDEVIVPGQTFIATWLAVSAVGAVPVPADVRRDSGQLDPRAVAAAVTPRTAAVLAVHLFGTPAPMVALRHIADTHGLALIEDAAQAHGALSGGRRAGSLSDIAAFSFYPGKNLGALGDGGAVVTDDARLADTVRTIANYGSRRKYHHEVRGENSRLDAVQAAVLRVKLPHLDGWNAHRRALAERYRRQLAELGVPVATVAPGDVSAEHLLAVRVPRRDDIAAALRARGVQTGVHYPHTPGAAPAYADLPRRGALPESAAWAREELSLPIGPTLDPADADRVVAAFADILEHEL
jgi:dTDP-4-amino-4,6-dideoxygalactose transaminase